MTEDQIKRKLDSLVEYFGTGDTERQRVRAMEAQVLVNYLAEMRERHTARLR